MADTRTFRLFCRAAVSDRFRGGRRIVATPHYTPEPLHAGSPPYNSEPVHTAFFSLVVKVPESALSGGPPEFTIEVPESAIETKAVIELEVEEAPQA